MRLPAERAWFAASFTLGRLLRAARYSNVRSTCDDGVPHVRKQRAFYAPLLVLLGRPLVTVLGTGVRVLPQREWEQRERHVYRTLHGACIRVDDDGALILPHLPGMTLAALLEDAAFDTAARRTAIELAARALGALHGHGLTHGDAMAENVMVDLDAGNARWFDFETLHAAARALTWRQADDVRALLATCVLRRRDDELAFMIRLILDAYPHADVGRLAVRSFSSVWQRALAFHLGQAGLTYRCFLEVGRHYETKPAGPRRVS